MQFNKFYTFYDFNCQNGYPPFKPLIQYRLKKRMESLVNLYPNRDRITWANYFVEIIKNSYYSELEIRLAYWHLLAYLDLDRCYLIWKNLRKFSFYPVKSQEFYDLTNNILFQPDKFKKHIYSYNPHDLSGANLKTYILGILKNIIREKLELTSSWRILCDVTINNSKKFDRALKKRKEALERYGVIEPDSSRYIFALKYFIPVYKTNRIDRPERIEGSKWPEPEPSDFIQVANYYNSQRFAIDAPLQVSAGAKVTPETIKNWMNICIKALQYYPIIIKTTSEIENYTQQRKLSNFLTIEGIHNESTELLQQVDLVLYKTIQKIEHNFVKFPSKIPQKFRPSIMPLCYPHPLTLLNQEKLGKKIGVHQGTISRYIHKYIETPLLKQFQQFVNQQVNIESYLMIFLEKRFSNPRFSNLLDRTLIEAIKTLDDDLQKILKFYYSQKMNSVDIARILYQKNAHQDSMELTLTISQKITEPQQIDLMLIQAKNHLQERLLKQLDSWQAAYIKLWLKKYYHEMIQAILLNSFKELNFVMQEILQMRYCQKMDEDKILGVYPHLNLTQTLEEAKQQLQHSLVYWVDRTLCISLAREKQQVRKTIEDWLSKTLIYINLQG